MEEIEKILGRLPSEREIALYEMVDKRKYTFIKDGFGHLRAVLKETRQEEGDGEIGLTIKQDR
jgi:hypothetical protein